jgi:hypothetical protein
MRHAGGQALAAEHARHLGHPRFADNALHIALRALAARLFADDEVVVAASCFIRRPTVSATAPPMPASISSKISVAAPAPDRAVVTAMANARRDSSPPDATLANARGVLPAWPATRSSTLSRPKDCGSSCAISATSKRPPAMPSCCIACVTASASFGAASFLALLTRCASARHARSASAAARSSAALSVAASSCASSARQPASSAAKSSGGRRKRRAKPIHADKRASSSVRRCGSRSVCCK